MSPLRGLQHGKKHSRKSHSLPSLICLPLFSDCPDEHSQTQSAPSTVPGAPRALCTYTAISPSLGQKLFPACSHNPPTQLVPHPCLGFASRQPLGSPLSSAPLS